MTNTENKLVYRIKDSENNLKLGQYLKKHLKFSTRFVRNAAFSKNINVNGSIVNLKYILKTGDIVEVGLEREESQDIEPQKMELEIVYEDSDVIVVNKPPYMVVHPTKSYQEGTLANGLLYYFKEHDEKCIVRLVSRLDMNTSGLILVAKNQFSHMSLARDMHSIDFEKSYVAVVHGNLPHMEGTIDLPILKPEDGSIKRIIDEKGQRSITHYKVLERYKDSDFVELKLETGRTHQIRVHLSHIGNPIFGDDIYGTLNDSEFIKRQALHAYKLSFPQPRTREKIVLECGLPSDIQDLLAKIKNFNNDEL